MSLTVNTRWSIWLIMLAPCHGDCRTIIPTRLNRNCGMVHRPNHVFLTREIPFNARQHTPCHAGPAGFRHYRPWPPEWPDYRLARELTLALLGIGDLRDHGAIADGGRAVHGAVLGKLPTAVVLPSGHRTVLPNSACAFDRALTEAPHILLVGTADTLLFYLPELEREGNLLSLIGHYQRFSSVP